METLSFILLIIIAAFATIAAFCMERQYHDERVRNTMLRERETVVRHMLNRVWRKYTLQEDRFIDKTEMLQQLITPLAMLGCYDLPEKEESKEESAAACRLSSAVSEGGH